MFYKKYEFVFCFAKNRIMALRAIVLRTHGGKHGGYATHRTQLSKKRMVIVQKCFLATRTFFKGKYSARQIDTT